MLQPTPKALLSDPPRVCDLPQEVLCRCLRLSKLEVSQAIARARLETVCGVVQHTGAGGGCTACHRRIKALLTKQTFSAPVADVELD